MSKHIISMSGFMAVAALVSACGGGASVATLNSAFKSPSAEINQTTTEAALESNDKKGALGNANTGITIPTFAGVTTPEVALSSAMITSSDTAAAAGVDMKSTLTTLCQAAKSSNSATVDFSKTSVNTANYKIEGAITYSFTCENNDTIFNYTLTYQNFKVTYTDNGKTLVTSANGSMIERLGSGTLDGADAFFMMLMAKLEGSFNDGTTNTTFSYSGGSAIVYKAGTNGNDTVFAGIVLGANDKYFVVYAVTTDGKVGNPAPYGALVVVKGSNGAFFYYGEATRGDLGMVTERKYCVWKSDKSLSFSKGFTATECDAKKAQINLDTSFDYCTKFAALKICG